MMTPRDNRQASRATRLGSSSDAEALSHAPHLRGLFPALERRAVDLLARLPASTDFRDEVQHALANQMTAGDMSIDAVAQRLVTTPRTLQRRLAETGTSFDALRDDARKRAAELYLSDATLSITEIAYLLGYSEPTGFHRAFRRWTAPHLRRFAGPFGE